MAHKIVIRESARFRLARILEQYPREYGKIADDFYKLARLPDPRIYRRVHHLHGDYTGSYRLAVYRPHHVRVIFCLVDGDAIFYARDPIPHWITIEICDAGANHEAYQRPYTILKGDNMQINHARLQQLGFRRSDAYQLNTHDLEELEQVINGDYDELSTEEAIIEAMHDHFGIRPVRVLRPQPHRKQRKNGRS